MRIALTALALTATMKSAQADPCTLGIWTADLGAIAAEMGRTMNGQAVPVGGQVVMEIAADGSFNLLSQNMTLRVTVAGNPPMDVAVNGYSRGSYDFGDGVFSGITSDINLVGKADFLGQTMEIPFDSGTGLFGSASGSYRCDTETLQFAPTATGSIPQQWTRQ